MRKTPSADGSIRDQLTKGKRKERGCLEAADILVACGGRTRSLLTAVSAMRVCRCFQLPGDAGRHVRKQSETRGGLKPQPEFPSEKSAIRRESQA